MAKTLYQLIRPFVPNLTLKISHLEPHTELKVRLRQHLGLVAKGASRYESNYVKALRGIIASGDTVFDVGANIGFYSVLFSCWVGRAGRVVAYEPDPANVKLLELNVATNKSDNISIRKSALGGKTGSDLFSIDTVTGSTGHLGSGPTYGETIFGKGREQLVSVDVTTLDREAENWGMPDLIKMDVEGGEFDVLCGGLSLLDHGRPLVVSELSGWSDGISGSHKAAFATQLLSDHDYLLWDLDTGRRVQGGDVVWMILGVPKERAAEERIVASVSQMKRSA